MEAIDILLKTRTGIQVTSIGIVYTILLTALLTSIFIQASDTVAMIVCTCFLGIVTLLAHTTGETRKQKTLLVIVTGVVPLVASACIYFFLL